MKNPPHPGRIVREECIEPLGLTVTKVARAGRSVYLQINAALQLQAITLGGSIQYLDPDEAREFETIPNRYQRAWEMWKRKAMGK